MLRFSANLGFLWPELPLLDRIDAAARAGFKAIELHWPYDTRATEVRARCERHGLKLLGLNTSRGDLSKGEFGLGALPGRQAEARAAFKQALDYCRQAGGSAIHCMAGKPAAGAFKEARATFLENLREASSLAADTGVSLLLEPINPRDAPGYFYSRAEEGAAIINEAGRDNIFLMFDCYHVGVSEGDILVKLERFLPVIGHVQIAAVPSRAEPDEGEINYRALFERLESLSYAGYVGCEYKPRAATDAGLDWTDRLGVTL